MVLNEQDAIALRSYAEALCAVQKRLVGYTDCGKIYDPLTVDVGKQVIYSYAFNLLNGGRRHPANEFESIEQIKELLLTELIENLAAEQEMVVDALSPAP